MRRTAPLVRSLFHGCLLLTLRLLLSAPGAQAQATVPSGPEGLVADSTELRVLREFYHATGGPQWSRRDNWLTGTSVAQAAAWYGVGVEQGDVTGLSFFGNNLRGTLPASLGGLRQLRTISIRQNPLTGALPASLSQLTKLETLGLGQNQLTGPVPAGLGQLRQLRHLDLSSNALSGPIPAELGRLSELTALSLHSNQLSGPIPDSLSNLRQLTGLDLMVNRLTGPLPASLGQLTQLQVLQLWQNNFQDSIPAAWGGLRSLQLLGLSEARLIGRVPKELGQLTALRVVNFYHTGLSGPLPAELGNWRALESASFEWNNFTGPLPASFGQWSKVQSMAFHHNQLSGPLPDSLFVHMAALSRLILHNNRFTGTFPQTWGTLTAITELSLSQNQFSGPLPFSTGAAVNLRDLKLANNRFIGPVPDPYRNLTRLGLLDLSGNELSGELVTILAPLRNVGYLDLSRNKFTGPLPLVGLTSLSTVNCSHNLFSGPIPDNLAGPGLGYLYADHNRLTGPVPASLAQLTRLHALQLTHNQLRGTVPAALLRLPQLYTLRLGDNHLTGIEDPGPGPFVTGLNMSGNLLDYAAIEALLSGPNQSKLPHFDPRGQRTPTPPDTLAVVHGTFPVLTDPFGGQHNRYQWQRQVGQTGVWTDLPGDTLATLRLPHAVREADEGTYRQQVTNRWATDGRLLPTVLYSRGVYLTLLPYPPLAFNEPTDGRDCPPQDQTPTRRPADRGDARDSVNYVRTYTARAPLTDPDALTSAPVEQVQVQTTYLDGLGRPVQTVLRQESPERRDVVQVTAYDALGRQPKQYLPYTAAPGAQPGAYRPNAAREQYDFHAGGSLADPLTRQLTANLPKTGVAYAESLFEASPLNRVLAQAAPGESWRVGSGHEVTTFERPSLRTDSIPRYRPGYGPEREELTYEGLYPDGELWLSEQLDEERHPTRVFTDKEGRVVLRRVATGRYYDRATSQNRPRDWQSTFYCYDDFGRLRATVPPLAARQVMANGYQLTGAGTELLLFRTHHDAQGRPVEQRTPDQAGYEYMVYDALDRPVLSQEVSQRGRGEWTASKYDALGRVVFTALVYFPTSTTREDLQTLADRSVAPGSGQLLYEAPSATPVLPGIYYTDQAFPRLLMAAVAGRPAQLLTATYYDSYDFDQDGTPDAAYTPRYDAKLGGAAPVADLRVTGQATRTLTRILDAGSSRGGTSGVSGGAAGQPVRFLTATSFFDEKLRVIQVQASNARGGGDTVTTRYDFAGKALASYATHTGRANAGAGERVTVRDTSTYDHAGRLLTSTQQVNQQPVRELTRHAYNENGQLASQRLGQWAGRALQEVNYRYNIRGWQTHINDSQLRGQTLSATTPADVWGWQLLYECGMNTPAFNGNIAGQLWRSRRDTVERAYGYRYDGASRLLQGDFIAKGPTGQWNSERSDYRFWAASYDANGNLQGLRRRALVQHAARATQRGQYAETDNLRYRYNPTQQGNRLLAVDDLAPLPTLFGVRQPERPDFKDVAGAQDYAYDVAGSLLSDANKKLTAISYNYLHLPEKLVFAQPGDSIRFVYTAAGQKVAKLVYQTGKPAVRTDYVGAWQYEQDTLRWLSTASGRTLREVDKLSAAVRFVNEYTIKDNLGNLRVALRPGTRRTYHASLEPAAARQETQQFDSLSVSPPIANSEQAAAGQYAAKLTAGGASPHPIGPTKLWAVQAGDTLSVETLAHYVQAPSSGFRFSLLPFLYTRMGQASSPGGEGSTTRTYTYLQLGLTAAPALPSFSAGVPRGYLRVLLYKADSTYLDSRLVPISPAAQSGWEALRVRPWVLPQGVAYAQVYVGNESDAPVWFDELRIEHRQGLQIQENHYDPFGLELAGLNHSPGLRSLNQYQFNGKEKQADLGLNWNHQDWRFYDAQIGRWHVVDPLADAGQEMWSTYQFGFDNAVRYSDPDGRCPPGGCPPGMSDDFLARGFVSTGMAVANLVLQSWAVTLGTENKYQAQFEQDSDGNETLDVEYVKVPMGSAGQEAKTATLNAVTVGLSTVGGGGPGRMFAQAGKVGAGAVSQGARAASRSTGPVTGYTKHGLNQAIGRNGGRGVSAKAMSEAVTSPRKITQQSGGRTRYSGPSKGATVVTNSEGKVVTTFGKSRGPQLPQLKEEGRRVGGGAAQRRAVEKTGASYNPNAIR